MRWTCDTSNITWKYLTDLHCKIACESDGTTVKKLKLVPICQSYFTQSTVTKQ